MEWHQLEYFKVLASIQHFTHAAEKLLLSQSALSRSIAKLEEELGFPLFDRIGKQVILNRYGKVFLQYAEESMQKIAEGKQVVQDMVHPDHGSISLAFMLSLGPHVVSKLLSSYNVDHPNIQFKLFQNSTSVMLNQLESGIVDLCLCALLPRPTITWQPLYNEELFAIVPHNHPLAARASIEIADIAAYPLITFKPDYALRVSADSLFQKAGIKPHIAFEGEEILTIAGLVEANMGVSLLPHNVALEHTNVTFLPISNPKCYRTIAIAWIENRYISPAVENFKDFIITAFKDEII